MGSTDYRSLGLGWLFLNRCGNPGKGNRFVGPEIEMKKIQSYYAEKMKKWYLETPVPELNEAFQHALLNIDCLCGAARLGREFPPLAILLACGAGGS